MNNDYYEEYKYHILTLVILIIIMFCVFFFFNNTFEEKNQFVTKESNSTKKETMKDTLKISEIDESIMTKVNEKKTINNIEHISVNKINNKFLLLSSNTEDNKFIINLYSKVSLSDLSSSKRKVDLTGGIKDNDKESFFPFFFKVDYLKIASDLVIEIINNSTKKLNTCEGNFLDTLSPDYTYYMQIEIYDDYVNCFIKSQSEDTRNNGNLRISNVKLNVLRKDMKNIKAIDFKDLKNIEILK